MDYPDALDYLKSVQEKGAKLTIENIQNIIDHLPFKLDRIQFIQVAGTNGKGSTSHFITSILQHAGFRVGLFTSPHLQDIKERITINKEWISAEAFADCLSKIRRICEKLLRDNRIEDTPTFFEHLFLTALTYFHRSRTDFVVLEVGLGGRLDATSTVCPKVAVITNISKDHTKTLGKRIKDIAFEKAGIIKPEVPVVCGCHTGSIANRVIREEARKKSAPYFNVFDRYNQLQLLDKNHPYKCTYITETDQYNFQVNLPGHHQTLNAATAIKTVETMMKEGVNIPKEAIAEGILNNFVPGRIEVINQTPSIILDSSHNVESIMALKNYLEQQNKREMTLVFGVLRDKNFRRMIEMLLPFTDQIILTEPISKRAYPAERLIKYFNDRKTIIKKSLSDALESARQTNREILITGSFYMVGEIRNLIFGGI